MTKSDRDKTRRIDWEEYSRLCQLLANKVAREAQPQTVVGIAHGGVIVGATVATILGRDFFPIKFSRRVNARVVRKRSKMLVPPTADLEAKRVLVVDDASDTGETMKLAKSAIQKHNPAQVITAVLVRTGDFEPEYVASYFPGKVVFPWIMEEQEPENAAKKTGSGSKKGKRSK